MTRTTPGASPLTGRTILITGAAGGIGAATAVLHGRARGHARAGRPRRRTALEQTVKEIGDDRRRRRGRRTSRDLASLEARGRPGRRALRRARRGRSPTPASRSYGTRPRRRPGDVPAGASTSTSPASSTPCGRPCRRSSSARATCSWCRRWPPSPRHRAWRRTTRARPASSTSPTRCSLEVKPHGVTVGSAHMSWIETPMVQEATAGPADASAR